MTNRNIKDLTNRKFGYLTVTGDTGKRTKSGNVEWECKCVCGTNVYHTARHLKTKKDLSCGCSNPKQEEYFLKMVKMFKDNGCVCLEVGYKSARLKWRFKCVCGNIGNLYPSDFKNGRRCVECGKKWSEDIRVSKQEIADIFDGKDDNFISSYFNKRTRVVYKCKNGHVNDKDFTSYKNGNGCRFCSVERNANNQRKAIPELQRELKEFGMEYIGGYVNADTKFSVKCSCGKITENYIGYIKKGGKCGCEYKRGSNNPKWNHNKTNEERELKRQYPDYTDWVKAVYKRDNYTCQSCWQYGGKLNAHHILPYNTYKEFRTDINNGITLCDFCHKSFHSLYGNYNFNKSDLTSFLQFTKEERWF